MATKKAIETKITEHVDEKVQELVQKACQETSWYKKAGYYVAAAIGMAVLYVVQNFGPQIWETVVNNLSGLF